MKNLKLIIPLISLILVGCKNNPYTVTFNGNGGTLKSGTEVQEVTSPDKIVAPIYERTGYTQNGWDHDLSKVTTTSTIKANWKANQYQVKFFDQYIVEKEAGKYEVVYNEIPEYRETIEYDQSASKPANPESESQLFTFENWYLDKEQTQVYDFNSKVTSDVNLYAKYTRSNYFLCVFKCSDDDIKSMHVKNGKTIGESIPTPATKEGHDFKHWYDSKDATKAKFDFATQAITDNKLFYPYYELKEYTVKFDLNGGTSAAIEPQKVKYDCKATKPADPTRTSTDTKAYKFAGWQLNGEDFDFDKRTIKGDVTLYAKWNELNRYKVVFDTDGGSTPPPTQIITSGETATKPGENPTKEVTGDLEFNKLTFGGWQLNGQDFDFNSPITSDIVLKAKWNGVYWWEDDTYLKNLNTSNVGLIRGVRVNNQIHQVRLIGIDKDNKSDGSGKAHTTWEFYNLLSDSNGHSLGYLWNDARLWHDYLNSSIRYTLTGQGNNCGHGTKILAAVKGGTNFNNEYRDKKIIDMLPSSLVNKLLTVKKYVTEYDKIGSYWQHYAKLYNDKLFMISPIEMGFENSRETKPTKENYFTYDYYSNHTEETDDIRCKEQVNIDAEQHSYSTISAGSGQEYLPQSTIKNYAGYFSSTFDGSLYWLRIGYIYSHDEIVWQCHPAGYLKGTHHVYESALPISPLFCL